MTDEDMDGFMAVETRLRARVRTLEEDLKLTNANLELMISVMAALQDSVKLLARHTENLEEARSAN